MLDFFYIYPVVKEIAVYDFYQFVAMCNLLYVFCKIICKTYLYEIKFLSYT